MMLNLLLPVLTKVADAVVAAIPDKRARNAAKAKLEGELVAAANAALKSQLAINEAEAAHKSLFVAGWRPFIGWVCGLGVFWAFLGQPFAVWLTALTEAGHPPPSIPTDHLFELVLAMLGIGGLRTFEKLKGVARRN